MLKRYFTFILPAVGILIAFNAVAQIQINQTQINAEDDSPWTDWYLKGTFMGELALAKTRSYLLGHNIRDPHVSYDGYGKQVDCTARETIVFRTADGTCNDLSSPLVGSAGVAFGRNVPPEFIDKDGAEPEKLYVPNPSEVSKVLFTRGEFKAVPWLNMLAASWIQFMNHDWLTHGKNLEGDRFEIPGGGSVEKTKPNPIPDQYFKPEYDRKVTLNDVTHWWDGSQIYGSSRTEQDAIRGIERSNLGYVRPTKLIGKIKTVMVNGRELLPDANDLNPENNKQNKGRELTGLRDNWWVGLSMLHHLFVKEHNAIASELIKKHVTLNPRTGVFTWKNGKEVRTFDANGLDEQVFQTARLINAAVMAKIHTVEWTPAILDHPIVRTALFTNWYGALNPQTQNNFLKYFPGLNKTDLFEDIDSGYLLGGIVGSKANNYGVPFSITEEFTSVYRLHSLLPEQLDFKKLANPSQKNPVPFPETRNEKSYDIVANNDLKDLFYSFGTQNPGQLVLNNFPKFMQELEIKGLGTMDLALVDVLRDRERGVPRYNHFRTAIGLKPVKKYADFFPGGKPQDERQQIILEKLNAVYGKDANGHDNVDMIDLLVGTSAEEVRPVAQRDRHGKLKGNGFGFGETMFQIFILMASRRLMTDRFFTDYYKAKYYTKTGLEWIDKKGWFHEVIARHMPELKPHMKGLKSAFFVWK